MLRMLQEGEHIGMPESRRMPLIGSNCHELRVIDENVTWRVLYGLASDAVVILEIFEKKTRATPKHVLEAAKRRWKKYLADQEED